MKPTTPLCTADIIIELTGGDIVLIERAHEPLGLALPGGFIDVGESAESAARREALEETGLAVTLRVLLGVYSDPKRDPRGATLSAVYIAVAEGEPTAGDDAARAFRADPAETDRSRFVFDHGQILTDYLHYRETGELPPPR